jgi:hypothetical protein
MDEKSYTAKIFRAVQTIAKNFSRALLIGGLVVIVSLGFADKAHAIYYHSDYARNASNIDSRGYYFLDYGQYYYLDREQYHLFGELDYFLGFLFYPKLYGKEPGLTAGFTNKVNTARFIFLREQVPFDRHALWNSYNLNNGAFIYRRRYYLSGGLDYSLGRAYYQRQLETRIAAVELNAVPEPSTIGFLCLGALGIVVLRNNRRKS